MKTAAELGITEQEYDLLPVIRDKLLDGSLVHSSKAKDSNKYDVFNMSITSKRYSCGTVGCIGGWLWILMNAESIEKDEKDGHFHLTDEQMGLVDDYVESNGGNMKELFYPPGVFSYKAITPAQAAKAIDNYLETGDPDWESMLTVLYDGTSFDSL